LYIHSLPSVVQRYLAQGIENITVGGPPVGNDTSLQTAPVVINVWDACLALITASGKCRPKPAVDETHDALSVSEMLIASLASDLILREISPSTERAVQTLSCSRHKHAYQIVPSFTVAEPLDGIDTGEVGDVMTQLGANVAGVMSSIMSSAMVFVIVTVTCGALIVGICVALSHDA
jgi:hypothetical protein